MNDKIKVLVVPSDRTGVSKVRSIDPHTNLEENFPDEFRVDIEYNPKLDDDEWLKQYDIIHFHRQLGNYEEFEARIERIRNLGIPTIMDIDDYWTPDKNHPIYPLIKRNEVDKYIVNNLKLVDYVTTTTSIYAEEISKLNKNVHVFPNAIDPEEKQFIPNPEKSDRVRIGWLGGSSHKHDLELLRGLPAKLRNDGLLDKIQFVVCGFDLRGTVTEIDQNTGKEKKRKIQPKESVWYEYEKIFTDDYSIVSKEYKDHLLTFSKDEYNGNLEDEPYRRVWTKPITSYARNYNLFDISLAPLVENKFNEMKSQLKVAEAGFHKKAIVAQDFGPYTIDLKNAYEKGGGINDEGNAFLVDSKRNHKDWYKYIKMLVKNPELITELGERLHEKISKEYDLNKISEERRDFYKKITNKEKSFKNEKLVQEKTK